MALVVPHEIGHYLYFKFGKFNIKYFDTIECLDEQFHLNLA